MKSNELFTIAKNEVTNTALKFFINSGVTIMEKGSIPAHNLTIKIDNNETFVIVNPFFFIMSEKAITGLYLALTKNEGLFGGERKVSAMIKAINAVIREGYSKGSMTSHNIQSGKYRYTAKEVLNEFATTIESVCKDHGLEDITKFSEILSAFGGFVNFKVLMQDVFEQVEKNIPGLEDIVHERNDIPYIPCLTCRGMAIDEDGKRYCKRKAIHFKPGTTVDSVEERYDDLEIEDGTGLIGSHYIDERCIDYDCEMYSQNRH